MRSDPDQVAPADVLSDEVAPVGSGAADLSTGPVRDPHLSQYLTAGGLYLVVSLVVWWHAWTARPSSVMTCACTDAGRSVWYLEWSAYALAHGHNLLFSTGLFHPDRPQPPDRYQRAGARSGGVAPITLLFGPVVSINLVSTLVPVAGGALHVLAA